MTTNGEGRKNRSKTGEKPGGPRLVEQAHGGMLWQGGHPNPTAGPGRPPSELRARMRGSLEERLAVVEEIADDPDARPADRIRALELLARFGIGQAHEVSGPDGEPVVIDEWKSNIRAELLASIRRLGPERFVRVLQQELDEESAYSTRP